MRKSHGIRPFPPDAAKLVGLPDGHRWYGAALDADGIILVRCLDCTEERRVSTALKYPR